MENKCFKTATWISEAMNDLGKDQSLMAL